MINSQPELPQTAKPARKLNLMAILPLAAFLALAGLFLVRLGAGDASRLPSPLVGKPAPDFSLPALEGQKAANGSDLPGFSKQTLSEGHVSLVNVFASWCVPCREEHPLLMKLVQDEELRAKGVKLYGLSYKDKPANSRQFIRESGLPYDAIGVDESGRTGIDFGVYGVPETFVVRADGTIAYKYVGPLTPEDFKNVLRPEILKAIN